MVKNNLLNKSHISNSLRHKLEIYYLLKKKIFQNQVNNLKFIFKVFVKLQKKKFLLPLKKNKKMLKKAFFYLFLKNFLLDIYSLINLIRVKKRIIFKKVKKKYLLFINIQSNNVFINFLEYKKKELKILYFWSSGFFKLHCTKRKLKFVIYTLLKEIKKRLKYISFYFIKIFCANFLHKYLYKNFKKLFFKSKFIIFTSFKIFNGCRSKKKRRKKHLKFRVLR